MTTFFQMLRSGLLNPRFLLQLVHIHCSALTSVVCTHDMAPFSLCFLEFWGFDMLGLVLATTSGISCSVFVFSAGEAVQNSPLHCRLYFICRWGRRKTNHNLTFHKNYVFVKSVIKSFALYSHLPALFPKFTLN
jgi:hypothetical protein